MNQVLALSPFLFDRPDEIARIKRPHNASHICEIGVPKAENPTLVGPQPGNPNARTLSPIRDRSG